MRDKKVVECMRCKHDFNEHMIFSDQFAAKLSTDVYQIKRFRTAVCREENCQCATARIYEVSRLEPGDEL